MEKINDIAELLELLNGADQATEADVMLESALALTTIFSAHIRRNGNTWLCGGAEAAASSSAKAAVGEWLLKRFNQTHVALRSMATHQESVVAWTAVQSIMKLLAAEKHLEGRSLVQGELLSSLISQLVLGPVLHKDVVDKFAAKYANCFTDVYVKSLRYLRKLSELKQRSVDVLQEQEFAAAAAQRRQSKAQAGKRQQSRKRATPEPEASSTTSGSPELSPELRRVAEAQGFAENMHLMLQGFQAIDGKRQPTANLFHTPTATKQQTKGQTKKARVASSQSESSGLSVKDMRVALDRAWMAFLKLSLPLSITKAVLTNVEHRLFPALMHPCLLIDFFTDAYNLGGVVSLLSLGGLFVLMTKHSLDYPDFYKQFYALLTPDVFLVAHREEVFKYAMLFLTSTHLPAYLVAAFIKRFATIALSAPPSGCLLSMALIFNLLYRHPQTGVLINRKLELPEVADPETGLLLQVAASSQEGSSTDAYLVDETDPAKSNALASSLWELEVLENHYCPAVSKFVKVFHKPYNPKTKQYPISEFAALSYSTLIRRDLNTRLKEMPIEFEKQPKLFQDGSLPTTLWQWQ